MESSAQGSHEHIEQRAVTSLALASHTPALHLEMWLALCCSWPAWLSRQTDRMVVKTAERPWSGWCSGEALDVTLWDRQDKCVFHEWMNRPAGRKMVWH